MAHEEGPYPNHEPVPDFEKAPSNLSNPELLSALDLALLELEKRLGRLLEYSSMCQAFVYYELRFNGVLRSSHATFA
jgi:hypothetical protein